MGQGFTTLTFGNQSSHAAHEYRSALASRTVPSLVTLTRRDEFGLIPSEELHAIWSSYKNTLNTAFGLFLIGSIPILYKTRSLYSGNTLKTAAAVGLGIWIPFYVYPITKTDKELVTELASHDTWLGRRLKAQVTPAPKKKAEAKKAH